MASMVRLDKTSARRLFAGLLAAMAAGALLNCRLDAPRQGWSRRWGPVVPHQSFPGDCGVCHVTERWDVLRKDFSFDHEKVTGYPLKGAHAGAACLRCHNDRGPVQFYAARGCGGCHPDPHTSSLGLNCERCHDQTSWRPTGLIAEHARTRFPLFGAHAVAPCERCHPEPCRPILGPVACDLCHRADLARATAPDHAASGWTNGCQRCHLPIGWDRAFVRHDFFPLSGGHAGLDCTRCHTSGVLGKIPSDCYSCHAANYQTAPGHVSSNFPHTCQQCHSITGCSRALRPYRVLPDRRPRQSGLYTLSHERHVRAASRELLLLSRDGLSGGTESLGPRFSADVPAMPHDDRLDNVHVPTPIPPVGAAQSIVHGVSYDRQHQHLQLSELPHGSKHERAPHRREWVQLRLAGVLPMSSDRAGRLRQVGQDVAGG
jgi:hypothetical protein